MTYAPIIDSSNPFATNGLSGEVRSILNCLLQAKAAGLDVVATSTTDHPPLTKAGHPSRHVMEGTDGKGLAVDCRLRTRGNGIHRAVFQLFVPLETRCHELIYADPPSGRRANGTVGPYNIKAGKRVAPYAVSTHFDHVHLSVVRGTFLRLSGRTSPTAEPVAPTRTFEEDDVPIVAKTVVAEMACPHGDGWYELEADGGVRTEGGCTHIYGSYWSLDAVHRNNPDRRFLAIARRRDGVEGYTIWATDGANYSFP